MHTCPFGFTCYTWVGVLSLKYSLGGVGQFIAQVLSRVTLPLTNRQSAISCLTLCFKSYAEEKADLVPKVTQRRKTIFLSPAADQMVGSKSQTFCCQCSSQIFLGTEFNPVAFAVTLLAQIPLKSVHKEKAIRSG